MKAQDFLIDYDFNRERIKSERWQKRIKEKRNRLKLR